MSKSYFPTSESMPAAPATAAPAPTNDPTSLGGNAAMQEHVHAHAAAPAPEGGGSTLWETGGTILGGLLGGLPGAMAGGAVGSMVGDALSAPPDLNDVLADLATKSPALATALDTARRAGWVFVYGTAGGGTFSDSAATPPTITIDPNDTANSNELAKSLAHELGHAVDGPANYEWDAGMSRDQYIIRNTTIDLEGEAEATIMELRVRDDVLASDGTDIGVSGATEAEKIALWEDHKAGNISREQLVAGIVELFARREHPSNDTNTTYWYYYAQGHADAYDQANPPASPLPIPGPP